MIFSFDLFSLYRRSCLYSVPALLFSFCCSTSYCQDSSHLKNDGFSYNIKNRNFNPYPLNKKKVWLVAVGNAGIYGSTLVGLNKLWYSQYPRSKFHFFNDNAEWLQVDKTGHAYSAYIESYESYKMWHWTGISEKKAILLGGLSGMAYQSIIEILDGFSAEYGFSPGDFCANIVGAGLFTTEQFVWNKQRIKIKFSFHKNNYTTDLLNQRADMIFGKTESERFIKDYNASTVWVSADIKCFYPNSKLPGWFAVAVGYGAQGMFGARNNIEKDAGGNVIFDASNIRRYRQWYLAPDIDLTEIHTNKKAVKIILGILNAFKFPTPSIEYSKGGFKYHWIHF